MRSIDDVREMLLDSTVRVIAKSGLEKATTKLIAEKANLNEAYIYRCYDSKEELFRAAFRREDMRLAQQFHNSLPLMRTLGGSWKERCFLLWKPCWEFVIHRPDECQFYLQYYYSANCRLYAYRDHLKIYRPLVGEVYWAFKPDSHVDILVHQIFDTMLSFAARVLSGEIEDCEETTKWTFEQVYSFVRPNAREDWVES